MIYYSSLATANCEFTSNEIVKFTASFSASASDKIEQVAKDLSEKAVLKLVWKYIECQPCITDEDIKITYDVKKIDTCKIPEPKTCTCWDNLKNKVK